MNAKIITLFSVCFMMAFVPFIFISEDSEGVSLPEHDYSIEIVNKTYYTNSPAEDIWLSDLSHPDIGLYRDVIPYSYWSGNMSVDRAGAPSWITYYVHDYKTDVKFTITPGAPCDDTFWILFNCYNFKLLVTFDITVINTGSVIPVENLKTFSLKFDSQGGSYIGSIATQSVSLTHTFNLKDVKSPVKDGYKFLGWSDDIKGNSVLVSSNYTLKITDGSKNASATLYAVWEKQDDKITIPLVWDDIMMLLSEPAVLGILAIALIGGAFIVRRSH